MPIQPLEPTDPEAVGPYLLLGRLGAGGMGRVYLARSAGGRTVAVKVVRAELADDPEFRERFRREVSAAQSVNGTYTAPVVDADRDGPTPWLATAYVLGPSLADAVAAHGPLPVDTVRALGTGLAEALAAIHGASLIHRDLKPSNVLLAADGPRVIDFGIARALDGSRMTSTGVVVGSPGFMCPEQANGAPMGPPGDVFSLGSVLAYAATGVGPFEQESDSAAAMLYRVIHGEPALASLPDALRPAVMACLAKNPADRPTPGELAALLGGSEPLARRAWLPTAVSSDIATHAAEVMDMETPARGSAVAAPLDPRAGLRTPTEFDTPVPGGGTVRLRAAPGDGTASGDGAASEKKPSRRLLLAGGGAAVVAAIGGAAAWALSSGKKPGPVPPKPTSLPVPLATRSRAPGMPPEPLWTYKVANNGLGQSVPLCAGELVYLGGDGLFALELGTGKERWTKPEAVANHFAVAGGTLSYGAIGDLLTVDAPSGSVLWKYAQKHAPDDPKSELSSDIVLAADDRAVYAMSAFLELDDSGLPRQDVPITPGILALSRKDGSLLWSQRRKAKADLYVNSVLTKDALLYTDSQKNLVARSLTDGSQRWFAETDSRGSYYLPVADGERVYCSSAGNGIQAVTIADGKQAWVKTSQPGSRVWYSPAAVADGVVYAVLGGTTMTLSGTTYTPGAGPVVIAHRATDGTELWRLPLPNECSMDVSPIVVQETLFVATDNKGIYAIDIKTHKVRWTFQNGLTGTVGWKFGTDGQRLIAVQGDHVYALPPV